MGLGEAVRAALAVAVGVDTTGALAAVLEVVGDWLPK